MQDARCKRTPIPDPDPESSLQSTDLGSLWDIPDLGSDDRSIQSTDNPSIFHIISKNTKYFEI